jgi:hypothetical protein
MKTWIEQYDANERALAFERRREAIERFGEHKEISMEDTFHTLQDEIECIRLDLENAPAYSDSETALIGKQLLNVVDVLYAMLGLLQEPSIEGTEIDGSDLDDITWDDPSHDIA